MKLWLENFHIPPHWNFWNWYMLLKLGLRLFSCWLHVRNTSDCTHQLLIFWKFEKLSDSRNSDQFLNTYTISYIYSWTCLKNHRVYFFSYFAKICNQKKQKGGVGAGGGGGVHLHKLFVGIAGHHTGLLFHSVRKRRKDLDFGLD